MYERPQILKWNPDYKTENLRRIRMWNTLKHDRVLQEAAMVFYKTHPKEWIEDYVFTYDPRVRPPKAKTMPFLVFPKQEELIDFLMSAMKDNENGLVEKSRDMGATWLCAAMSVWLWLFEEGSAVGWGSRKEDLVDEIGNPDSIFEKMRIIINHLPTWQKPADFDPRRHATYMKIINPQHGSTIIGEVGDNIGRGGRSSIYFKDESAHYARPEKIEAALSENTNVQIDISSVAGTGNIFYRRRMAGEVWTPNTKPETGVTRVFIMDWRDHPNKTEEWYTNRKKRFDKEGLAHVFAQEVDRDYTASLERIIILSKWVNAAVDAHIILGFEASGQRRAGQDVADDGGDKNAYVEGHGVVVEHCEEWGGESDEAAKTAIPIAVEHGVTELYYDAIGVGSGFKAGAKQLVSDGTVPETLQIYQWWGSAEVLDKEFNIVPDDDQSPKNEDFYENLKAQGWWRLRAAFKKTHDAVQAKRAGKNPIFDPAELISLDSRMENLHALKMQLSQAVHKQSKAGKTMVDKKPKGARSPNLADAMVIWYTPTKELSILDVL